MRATEANEHSRKRIWAGRILTVLTALFMLLDGVMKIVKPPQVLEANVRPADPLSVLRGIGIALIACTLIYLIPRTSILGAVLLTGYLGGPVASNVRAGSGRYSQCSSLSSFEAAWGCEIVACGAC
jgi:DoxX-like family